MGINRLAIHLVIKTSVSGFDLFLLKPKINRLIIVVAIEKQEKIIVIKVPFGKQSLKKVNGIAPI
jgi:hypothetical protein